MAQGFIDGYAPLSDPVVVTSLIENRYLFDGKMNEDAIAAYIDLDDLIVRTRLSRLQRFTVEMLMQGFTLAGISREFRDGSNSSTESFRVYYRRAVNKLIETARNDWQRNVAQDRAANHPGLLLP